MAEHNDYSVGITCFVKDGKFYLAVVVREKLEYPQLKQRVISNFEYYKKNFCKKIWVSIEDKSSGIQLIQELKKEGFPVIIHSTRTSKEEHLMRTHYLKLRMEVFFCQNRLHGC